MTRVSFTKNIYLCSRHLRSSLLLFLLCKMNKSLGYKCAFVDLKVHLHFLPDFFGVSLAKISRLLGKIALL